MLYVSETEYGVTDLLGFIILFEAIFIEKKNCGIGFLMKKNLLLSSLFLLFVFAVSFFRSLIGTGREKGKEKNNA